MIRELREQAELREVESLQREVWGVADLEIVSTTHFIASIQAGAIVLGAFEEGKLAGFAWAFPGFDGKEPFLHSDMLAVRPAWRDRGIGRALKLAQRDHALRRGFSRITWTFDPLQSRNAYLNLHILGVTSRRYLRDLYGTTSSPLHAAGTDRLWVEWDLKERTQRELPTRERIEIPTLFDPAWRLGTREAFESAFARGLILTDFERGPETSFYLLK